MVDKNSFESLDKHSSQKPHSLCLSSLDDLHNPCPTLQEKEAIVTEADDPQVTVASVSNWLANVRRQSGWNNICNDHCDGDVKIKAMVDLCTRVLKGTNTHQPSDSDASNVVKEILNMQSRAQALNDVQTEAGEQWSIVLCDLLKRCTMEEQESMGSSESEEFLDTPLSSSAPGTPEENRKTQECNPEDETCSQLSLSARVVLDSLVACENRDDERGQQEEMATSSLSVPKSIPSLEGLLTCPDSEAQLSNGSRSERFLSDLNVGLQSGHVLCQPDYAFTFITRSPSPELPAHKEFSNPVKLNVVGSQTAQKHSGAYLKAEDSEAHKRRRLSTGNRNIVSGSGRSQDYVTIPVSKADLSSLPVAFDSVDDYNVQSTHSGSQKLAFQEVDCHPSQTMLIDDDMFNTPNLEIENPDWSTIPEIEDCAYEGIFREWESISAQPTFVSEFVEMPRDMTWSTDFASVTIWSETEASKGQHKDDADQFLFQSDFFP